MPNDDLRAVLTAPLHEVPWLHIGRTEEYADLKAFIALVCHDVTHAACIDELCINDVVQAFLKHGYVVVPASALERLEAAKRERCPDKECPRCEYWRKHGAVLADSGMKEKS